MVNSRIATTLLLTTAITTTVLTKQSTVKPSTLLKIISESVSTSKLRISKRTHESLFGQVKLWDKDDNSSGPTTPMDFEPDTESTRDSSLLTSKAANYSFLVVVVLILVLIFATLTVTLISQWSTDPEIDINTVRPRRARRFATRKQLAKFRQIQGSIDSMENQLSPSQVNKHLRPTRPMISPELLIEIQSRKLKRPGQETMLESVEELSESEKNEPTNVKPKKVKHIKSEGAIQLASRSVTEIKRPKRKKAKSKKLKKTMEKPIKESLPQEIPVKSIRTNKPPKAVSNFDIDHGVTASYVQPQPDRQQLQQERQQPQADAGVTLISLPSMPTKTSSGSDGKADQSHETIDSPTPIPTEVKRLKKSGVRFAETKKRKSLEPTKEPSLTEEVNKPKALPPRGSWRRSKSLVLHSKSGPEKNEK